MKKVIVSLWALLALSLATSSFAQLSGQVNSLPGLPQTSAVVLTAAPQFQADGTPGPQIADRERNTKVTLGHAEYTESTRRGKVFSTANLGFTVVAANATKGAIATFQPIVGFINPTGSGINAIILNHREWHTSGTPGGPLIFNYFCGVNWVAPTLSGNSGWTIFGNLLSNNTPNGSAMIPVNGLVPTTNPAITTAMNAFLPAGGPPAVAIATADSVAGHSEDDKGQIAVPPGCLFALASTATGTSDVVNASLTWEEVSQ